MHTCTCGLSMYGRMSPGQLQVVSCFGRVSDVVKGCRLPCKRAGHDNVESIHTLRQLKARYSSSSAKQTHPAKTPNKTNTPSTRMHMSLPSPPKHLSPSNPRWLSSPPEPLPPPHSHCHAASAPYELPARGQQTMHRRPVLPATKRESVPILDSNPIQKCSP